MPGGPRSNDRPRAADAGAKPGKLAVLKNRNYAPYFAGMLVSQTGMWMQVVAEGWLVLKLTDKVSALGLVHFAFALPNVILSLWGGALADRFDRRRVVIV